MALPILEEYQVRYVILGDIEYSTYQPGSEFCPNGLQSEKFNENLIRVFQNENLVIYEVPGSINDSNSW